MSSSDVFSGNSAGSFRGSNTHGSSSLELDEELSLIHGYDLIGDVHGCDATLERLLCDLGYRKQRGVYRHRSRQAIFVGDIIDRGPRIREALHRVHDMVECGAAKVVMGNHEYYALAYNTPAPADSGRRYVREHLPQHDRLIAETHEQFANHSQDWRDFLGWFMHWPLFLEFDDFRVVHACWDEQLIGEFRRRYPNHCMDDDFLLETCDRKSFASRVIQRLTRGTDMRLPDGMDMTSADGYVRCYFRTKFWAESPQTYRDIVFQPDPLPDSVIDQPLNERQQQRVLSYGAEERPLFFGHYWLQGRPEPLTPNLACLDYSAVKYGRMVAYRMDGEQTLDRNKFVWVYVDPERF